MYALLSTLGRLTYHVGLIRLAALSLAHRMAACVSFVFPSGAIPFPKLASHCRYVGGLAGGVVEGDLRDQFYPFGEIRSIRARLSAFTPCLA